MIETTIVLEDGFRVGVTVGGKGLGTTLVFLHGLGVSAAAYRELLDLLAEQFYVVAIDAPDHGRSDALAWGHTVADMADVVARALNQLNVGSSVLVGHSMGGAIVAELAATYPGLARMAVLLDAAAGEEHHRGIQAKNVASLPLRAAHFLSGAVRDIAGDAYQAGTLRRVSQRLDLASRLRGSLSGLASLRAAYALMKHDTEPLLSAMRYLCIDTAVLHGAEDRIVPWLAGMNTARVSGGQFYTISGRFHSWMISDPLLGSKLITLIVNATVGEAA